MDRVKTVTDAKAAFIRSQIRLLSAVLQPSQQWRDFAPESKEGDLSGKVVQDVMVKVNEKVKQHNRAVYSAQSQRHVAEQIDTLYWQTVRHEEVDTDSDTVTVNKDMDLTSSEAIKSLPQDYADLHLRPDSSNPHSDTANRYRDLHDRLTALNERRDQQRQRLAQYQELQKSLEPFVNAQDNIQPNLVTRDGELGKELDRMRILLARVPGRVNEINGAGTVLQSNTETEMSHKQKLAAVLDLT